MKIGNKIQKSAEICEEIDILRYPNRRKASDTVSTICSISLRPNAFLSIWTCSKAAYDRYSIANFSGFGRIWFRMSIRGGFGNCPDGYGWNYVYLVLQFVFIIVILLTKSTPENLYFKFSLSPQHRTVIQLRFFTSVHQRQK